MGLRPHLFGILALVLAAGVVAGSRQQPTPPPKKVEQPKKAPKKRLVADLSGFELQDPKKLKGERTTLGATRGGKPPAPLAPSRAKFFGASPLFEWSYEGKARSFKFFVFDENDKIVFEGEAKETRLALPGKLQGLTPGRLYFWYIDVQPPLIGMNSSEAAEFVVVSEAERTEIEKRLRAIKGGDEYQQGLSRAQVFIDHRLWYDAIGVLSDLIAVFPDRAEVYEQRGMVYAQLEVTKPNAERDFIRAEELQGVFSPSE